MNNPASSQQPDAERAAAFMRLLHAFQSVERVAHAPDLERKENDVEHSYLLTMLCWYFCDVYALRLSREKVLRYALVHDFVEVYAGDTYIFDAEGLLSKQEREEKARIRIYGEFPEFRELHKSIASYEERSDPEATFVHSVDKLIPLITSYIQRGHTWKQVNMQPDDLFAHKRRNITHKEIRDLLEQFIRELALRRSDFFNPQ